MENNLKDKLKTALPIRRQDKKRFISLYFKSTRRKHDSGYFMYEIYGEDENQNFYILSRCSDVIDFEKISCNFDWFASIDIPYPGIFRIFPRNHHYFITPYYGCSSFLIQEYTDDGRII